MKRRIPFLITITACAATFSLFAQTPSTPDSDAKAVNALIQEIQTQQKAIADNQAKIDEKLATIGEEVRLARLFVSRGGK